MESRNRMGRRGFVTAATALTGLSAARAAGDREDRCAGQEHCETVMQSFRVAAVAFKSLPVSPERNLTRMAVWIEKARQGGAALVCFPEMCVTGYLTTPEIWQAAEQVPGPSTRRLEEIAKHFRIQIAVGIAERDRGIVYDTYVFVGPEGYLGKSRKIHIPPAEVGYWRGGGVPPVIDIGLAKVGVNICFDNWLPESSRLVALQGAEVVFAPFVWAVGEWGENPNHTRRNRAWKEYAGYTFPARAIDNGVFVVATNACGPVPNGRQPYNGNPVVLVYSPMGKLVAESPDDAGEELLVMADLDRKLLVERRSQSVFHPRFRRPELYRLLCQGDIGPQSAR